MLNQFPRKLFSLKKIMFFGIALLFLVFIVGCEFFHADSDCGIHRILTNQLSGRENLFIFSILLFSFVINSVFFLAKEQDFWQLKFSLFGFLVFRWFWQWLPLINNPILKAFRQGIIHPQIYNLKVLSD